MKDVIELLINKCKELYDDFIVRDITAIILPGFISLLFIIKMHGALKPPSTIFNNIIGFTNLSSAHNLIFLFILSYAIGWGLWGFGRLVGIIKLTNKANLKAYFDSEMEYYKSYKKNSFLDKNREVLYKERITVINLMAGNYLMCFILLLILIIGWVICIITPDIPHITSFDCLFILYIVIISSGFWKTHRDNISNREIWEQSRIDSANGGE